MGKHLKKFDSLNSAYNYKANTPFVSIVDGVSDNW